MDKLSSAAKTKQQHEQYEQERVFLRELLIACEKDDVNKVKELAKKHPICDYRDGKRAGAIHAACRGASLRTIEFLLSIKPEQAALKDAELRTPLMTCCFAHDNNSPACLTLLLKNKHCQATIEDETVNGVRAVHFAASLDSAECLEVLLTKAKADPMAPSPAGYPLAWAVAHAGNAETTKLLLKQPKVDVNATGDVQEPSVLLVACLQNKLEIATVLVQHGAHLDTFTHNLSPLHACCATGALDCAKLLLSQPGGKALCLLRDPVEHHLPIEVAIETNQVEIAQFLALDSGFADRNIPEWIAQTQAQHDHITKVNVELAAKADSAALAEKDLANLEFATGAYEKAAKQYLDTANKYGTECSKSVLAVLYSNAAACYLKVCSFTEAREYATLAVEADPTHCKSFLRLGQACHGLKDHEAAARAYWSGHEADKTSPDAARFVALFKKEIETAKKLYHQQPVTKV
ncbi:hypothetical protein BASA81_012601 [Batrachochytrium salamandrivorans]|nr:hypothetical protein BASA81_012601 [Batrachochytrium salamandrivorans]